jgi:hypothetical protein
MFSDSLLISLFLTRYFSICSSSISSMTWMMFSLRRSVLMPSA